MLQAKGQTAPPMERSNIDDSTKPSLQENDPASSQTRNPTDRLQVLNVNRQTKLAENLEVASSGPARSKGLLGRKGLEPGGGLWIVPCEAVHTFWMQFPIDLVYIDRKHCVKKVRGSVPPWRLSACLSAHSILELPAGTIQTSGTCPGDQLEFQPGRQQAPPAPIEVPRSS